MSITLAEAIEDMAMVFGDGMFADHVGEKFTCGEAETVARVLALAGHTDAAEVFLMGHAQGDIDSMDIHSELFDQDAEVAVEHAAADYVRGLVA